MPDVTNLTEDAWTNLPPAAAALFIVLIIILIGGIWLATTYMKTYGAKPEEEKKEAPAAQPKGRTFWEGITKSAVEQARQGDDVSEERVSRVEDQFVELSKQINRLDERLDELFRVEGKHRQELLDLIKRLEDRLEKLRDKHESLAVDVAKKN